MGGGDCSAEAAVSAGVVVAWPAGSPSCADVSFLAYMPGNVVQFVYGLKSSTAAGPFSGSTCRI